MTDIILFAAMALLGLLGNHLYFNNRILKNRVKSAEDKIKALYNYDAQRKQSIGIIRDELWVISNPAPKFEDPDYILIVDDVIVIRSGQGCNQKMERKYTYSVFSKETSKRVADNILDVNKWLENARERKSI